jgi:hypothetical protein
MLKINLFLIPAIGLLILFSLCSYIYAQELQFKGWNENQTSVSVNNNESANQTVYLTSNGETSKYIFTDEKIKELFASQESKSNDALRHKGPDKDFKYAYDITLKANNQIKLKYSECNITNFPTISIIEDIIGSFGEIHISVSGGLIEMEEHFNVVVPCHYNLGITRDTDSLSYVKNDMTNLNLLVKCYRYHSWEGCPLEKKHHHDQARECKSLQDRGYSLVVAG